MPKVGDKLLVNPEFEKIVWERGWQEEIWYMYIRDGGYFHVERINETDNTLCIKLSESPIEIVVLKQTGQAWWLKCGPHVFYLEDE